MWEIIDRDEQETLINVDYYEKTLSFYTTRKSVARRLEKKVGKPTKVDMTNGKISGVTYIRNLHDDDIKSFFSISSIIGGFRNQNNQNEECIEEED